MSRNLHQKRTHPTPVEGCFGCKAGTIRLSHGGNLAAIDKQRAWDKELDSYESAVNQGMEPESTRTPDIKAAVRWSDKHGVAYSEELATETRINSALERL